MYVLLFCFLQRDQREALRVLSELKAVISIRAQETVERERTALLRQNPDYKFVEEDFTWNDGKQESRISEKQLGKFGTNGPQAADQSLNSASQECVEGRQARIAKQSVIDTGAVDMPPIVDCSFTKHVAMLAIAKSMQMASLPAETFGDDGESCSDDSRGDDAELSDWDVDDSNTDKCDAVNGAL